MPKQVAPSYSQSWMPSIKSFLAYLGNAAAEHFIRGLAFACDYAMPGLMTPYEELPPPSNSWAYFITTLFFFPLTVLGGIAGFSIVPLIFYSFIVKFPYHLMAPIRWMYADKESVLQSLRNFDLRHSLSGGFYGLPGILLGSAMGYMIASSIWLKRTIESTYRFNRELFKFVKHQTLAFINKQPLRQHPLDQYDEQSFSNFEVILGLLPVGWALGIAISTVTFSAFILGLAVKHSAISFYRSLARRVNAGVKDQAYQLIPLQMQKSSLSNKSAFQNRNQRQHTLAIPGHLLGSSIGLALFFVIIIGRMIENTPEHVYRNFCRGARAMQPQDTPLYRFFKLPKDKRTDIARSLGILGIFPLGLVSGMLGLILGSVLRLGALSVDALTRCCKPKLREKEEEERKELPSSREGEVVSLESSSSTVLQQLAQQQPSGKSPTPVKNATHPIQHPTSPSISSRSKWMCPFSWLNPLSSKCDTDLPTAIKSRIT